MADYNKVILIGRLTKDLELKVTQSGIPVVSGSIAVNRPYKQDKERKADFFNFTAWRGTAEFIARYFHQGSNILIEGALQTRDYTANDGSKRYVTEVVVATVLLTRPQTRRRTLHRATICRMVVFPIPEWKARRKS